MLLAIRRFIRNFRDRPNRDAALAQYREFGTGYDQTLGRGERLRHEAIAMLDLRRGETVIDVACGSGLSLAALANAVGPSGQVIGIDQCPVMAGQARERVARARWKHVSIVNAPVECAPIGQCADAVLFCYTHDVLQAPCALAHLIEHAAPRARIAIAGLRTVPWWWGAPVNLWNMWRTAPYLTTFAGLREPWRFVLPHCPNLAIVRTWWLGSYYVAVGVLSQEKA